MRTATLPKPAARHPPESVGILRWVFVRGTHALTCEVRVNGQHSHDVCVVPHWDVSSSVVEQYARPASALRRHAEIASHFRHSGWTLIREGLAPRAIASA
jgi:hypothetical protein